MVRAALAAAAVADVWTAITAIQLYYSLNLQPAGAGATTTTTPAQASASAADFRVFLMFVAAGGLYTAVALVYRRVHQAEAAAAAAVGGGNRRRLSDLVAFIFAAAGILEFFFFVDGVGALGLAAFHALPAAATATFFGGMTLIIVAHIRAGGEGGGGAFAGEGQIQGAVSPLLTKTAFGAAAALVCLMAMALYAKY